MTVKNVSQLARFAELSLASYANFGIDNESASLQNVGMAKSQATAFLEKYEVVNQVEDSDTGFSATVFKEQGSDRIILSIRGTERSDLEDWLMDILSADVGQIGPDGYAKWQAASLYRYWRSLTTAAGDSVDYTEVEMQKLYMIHSGLWGGEDFSGANLGYVQFKEGLLLDTGIDQGQGVGKALLSEESIVDVAGHSLGGHLAMLFARFFPDNVNEVVTVNAPGFFPNSELLSALGFKDLNDGRITRIVGEGDVVSKLGTIKPGVSVLIAQEATGALSNHSVLNSSDALALMSLFENLDAALGWNIFQLSNIVRASSVSPAMSYEGVLDSLRKIFLGADSDFLPTILGSDSKGRNSFYDNIAYLKGSDSFRTAIGKVKVVSLLGLKASEIASLAASEGGEAYRYALLRLDPFAVVGFDFKSSSDIALYDPVSGNGALTAEWLSARAELLSERLDAASIDTDVIKRAQALSLHLRGALVEEKPAIDPLNLFGSSGSESLSVGSTLEEGGHLFGESGSDTLLGQALNDYLEGGSGNDKLEGNDGADWLRGMQDNDTLIGGQGNDLLEGGLGNDVYEFKTGDGLDRIKDTDGEIFVNGRAIPALKQISPGVNVWSDEKKTVFVTLSNDDQGVRQLFIDYGVGDRIIIGDFKDGAFGFSFSAMDFPEIKDPVLRPEYVGDSFPADSSRYDYKNDTKPEWRFYDELSVWEKIDEAGVVVEVDSGELRGFTGNDTLSGNSKADLLIGGSGRDYLYGFGGNDLLVADDFESMSEIVKEDGGRASKVLGDALDGGAGDDFLIGSKGQDLLLGGTGVDHLYGGDGDDVLMASVSFYSVLSRVYDDWGVAYRKEGSADEKDLYYQVYLDGYKYNPFYYFGDYNALVQGGYDEGEHDVLVGGAGSDWLFGSAGNNFLDGGSDNDVEIGKEGRDTLLGGGGNDVLVGDDEMKSSPAKLHGDDFLDGGADNDRLVGGGASDILLGGAGEDTLIGDGIDDAYRVSLQFHGGDYLDGGSDNDLLIGGGGADTLLGGSGDDEIQGDGTGIDRSYSGNDSLEGGSGNDRMFGNDGNDSLYGGEDNDTVWGDGQSGQAGDDYLDGGEGDDQLLGGAGADNIFGGSGNDILWGDEDSNSEPVGNDHLDGGLGEDTLYGGGGDDTLLGGAGEDIIQGNAGNNLFDGGTGDDRLFGETGNDTYLFNLGYGIDRFADKGGVNSVRFGPGITMDSLAISVSNNSQGDVLILSVGSDAVRLLHMTTWSASKFIFADGDSYSYEQILLKLPQAIQQQASSSLDPAAMFGSLYDDSLAGGEGNDSLKGQAGNDTLVGGKGDDTYLFNVGDGQDLIRDTEGSNIISFGADIGSSSLTFSTGFSAEGESYLKVGYGDDFVMIERGLWGAIKAFEFADGTSLSFADAMRRADSLVLVLPDEASMVYGSDQADRIYGGLGDDAIDAQGGDDQVSGGAGNDTLIGGEGNDELAGDQGDDHLVGGSGNDQLLGGAGNDLLNGGEGNDWLSGGAGQDTLSGGTGINTYVFERGMGFDLIELTEGESAILKICSDIFRQDLVSRQDGKDLLLEVKGSQDGARLKDYFSASRDWKVDTGSGSLVDLTTFLFTTSSGYSMTADEAERVFRQQVLSVFKERMDTINAQAQADGTYRTHSVSESVSSRVDSYSNYSLVFSEEAVGSVVRSENRYAYRSISEAKDSRAIRLSGGSDTVYDSGGFVSFAQFNKMLNGRAGGLQTDGWVPVFKYNKNTGAQELIGWQVTLGADTGLSAKKTFTTTNIDNASVNKVVRGDASNRNVVVGLGNIYRGGEGSEQLYGEDLNYANGSAGVFLDGGAGNDYLAGSRKNDFLVGGLGDDTLEGDAGSDTYIISKGEGVSIISDGFRSIKYIGYDPDRLLDGYHRGYSAFTPDESEKNDIIVLPEGVSLADLKLAWGRIQHEVYVKDAVLYDPTRRYGATQGIAGSAKGIMAVTTLDVSWSDNQKIRIVMPFQHDPIGSGIDKIQFADGTLLTLEQLRSKLGLEAMPDSYAMDQRLSRSDMDGLHLQRADGPDSVLGAAGGYLSPYAKIAMPLVGGSGSDTLSGGGVLWGGDGNDSLLGDTGADDLIGGFGADTLLGGEGDDRLGASLDDFYGEGNLYQGGRGKDDLFGTLATDTYIYDRGDGADRIIDLYAPGYSNAQLYYNGSAQAVLDSKITSPFSPLLLSRQTMSWRNQHDSDAPYYKGLDTVRFGEGIALGDLGFELEGSDLVIRVSGSDGDSLRFVNWSLFATKPLGRIVFADGTVLEGAALSERLPTSLVLSGTDNSDYFGDYPQRWVDYVVRGQGGNDTLRGYFGNNTFHGDQGNDLLEGGRGNDYLNGGDGDDTLRGSSGNDTLEGGAGNDVYAFSRDSMEQGVTRILDLDKSGLIQFDWKNIDATKVETVARNQWRALDGSYLLTFDDVNAELLLQAIDADGTLLAGKVVVSSFGNGDLGLLLPGLEVAAQVPAALKALPEQTLSSGHEWNYCLAADSFFPQGVQVSVYSATLKDGSALPSWLQIDATTGALHGNAPGVGSLSLIVQATDAQGQSVQQSLDVKIELNRIEAVEGKQSLGGNGDDYIIGTAGDNQLLGGLGSDMLVGGDGADQIWGEDGDDQLLGGVGNDSLQGNAGNDMIDAGEGDDWLWGGQGNDIQKGGDGHDLLWGEDGDDQLFGDAGNDSIQGNSGDDLLNGGAGEDRLWGGQGNDTQHGGDGHDQMWGEDGDDQLFGGADNDGIQGNAGNDLLDGGTGDDWLWGGLGSDTLSGGDGQDYIWGEEGDDLLSGGAGNDGMQGNAGNDQLDGGVGDDWMWGGQGIDTLSGGDGQDRLWGEEGDDQLSGGIGDDWLLGGAGNDLLSGGAGSDTYVFGIGAGQDTVSIQEGSTASQDVMVFEEGIFSDQLWFSRNGDDLQVRLIGRDDRVTLSSWYADESSRLGQLKVSDGKILLESQVQNLVDAMAGFAPPEAGQFTLPDNYEKQLSSVIAANWQ